MSGFRHANRIIVTDDRRKIAGYDQKIGRVIRETDIGKHALVGIIGVNPLKTFPVKIVFI